jgi:hypothetical protein
MDLLAMLVELPLHGFHRRCRVPGQPRSANRKVFVATGALAVQPGFVVLGDLKMWLFHASSMAQSGFQFQIAKIRTAPLPKKGGKVKNWKDSFTIELEESEATLQISARVTRSVRWARWMAKPSSRARQAGI